MFVKTQPTSAHTCRKAAAEKVVTKFTCVRHSVPIWTSVVADLGLHKQNIIALSNVCLKTVKHDIKRYYR